MLKQPFTMRKTARSWLCLLLLLSMAASLFACATSSRFVNQVYRRGRIAYRVGSLPDSWRRIAAHGADLAFRRRDGGTIVASARCDDVEDVPLDVLTNHLLFEIVIHGEFTRTPFTLDGRAALRTRLEGELDGVPVALDLIVMKKDGCTYDLQLIAAPVQYARCQADFDAFVRGFAALSGT